MDSKECRALDISMGILFVLFSTTIVASTDLCSSLIHDVRENRVDSVPFWKREVFYQIYPRSFLDGDGEDGTGDLRGIASKVDYLKDLGIGAVWLNPINSSPMLDFGYDISNFTEIDPIFGTMEDFEELLNKFHEKGLKVVTDLVPNHTSNKHEWFVKSVREEGRYADYYIWENPIGFNETGDPIPPNNWLSKFRGSAWTWREERQQFYYHQYLAEQPDLNYRSTAVREEMMSVFRFWLEKGVDGFRVDALSHLFEAEDVYQDEPIAEDSGIDDPTNYHYLNHTLTKNQPETLEVLREWRTLIDGFTDKLVPVSTHDDRWMTARTLNSGGKASSLEIVSSSSNSGFCSVKGDLIPSAKICSVGKTLTWALDSFIGVMMVEAAGKIEEVMKYYGNETTPLADFPFNFLLVNNMHNRSDFTGVSLKTMVDKWIDNMPEGKWPNWVIGNHDQSRVGSRLGTDLIDALNMMSLLLPGTAISYYGEEIGMVNTWISWEDTQDPSGCRYGPDHYTEHSRDPERTPMQWDGSDFAGFTTGNDSWLPVNENYQEVNVKKENEEEGNSHLKLYQILTRLRKEPAFAGDQIAFPVVTEDIFSFVRFIKGRESYLVVINTSEKDQEIDLHHSASFQLPETGVVILRSVTDTSVETVPGSTVSLDSVNMVGGEGLMFSLDDKLEYYYM